MEGTRRAAPELRNIYIGIFILGALLHLLLVALDWFNSLGMYTPQPDRLVGPLVGTIIFFVLGWIALRATQPDTLRMRRLGIYITLLPGIALGTLMAIGASGPNEAALGVALFTLLPFPLLLIEVLPYVSGPLALALLPIAAHVLVFVGLGCYAYWTARRAGAVRYGIGHALLLSCMLTFFTLLGGIIASFAMGKADMLLRYGSWGELFVIPLAPLVLYTLTAGVLGAFLSRLGRGTR